MDQTELSLVDCETTDDQVKYMLGRDASGTLNIHDIGRLCLHTNLPGLMWWQKAIQGSEIQDGSTLNVNGHNNLF